MSNHKDSIMFPMFNGIENSRHPHRWRALEYLTTLATGVTSIFGSTKLLSNWHETIPLATGSSCLILGMVAIGVGAADSSHHASQGLDAVVAGRKHRRTQYALESSELNALEGVISHRLELAPPPRRLELSSAVAGIDMPNLQAYDERYAHTPTERHNGHA